MKKKFMENQLIDYIRSVSDFPQERVKAALVQQGWSLENIESAFLQVQHEQSIARASVSQYTQAGVMTASFLIIAMVLFAAPGVAVTGNIVYVDSTSNAQHEVFVSEEIIQPSVQEEATAPVQRAPSCASVLNTIEREKCFAQEALAKSDVRICNSVSDSTHQTSCVALVAVQNKDVRLCANAKVRDNCTLSFAKVTGDKKACEPIMNAPLQENCISHLA